MPLCQLFGAGHVLNRRSSRVHPPNQAMGRIDRTHGALGQTRSCSHKGGDPDTAADQSIELIDDAQRLVSISVDPIDDAK